MVTPRRPNRPGRPGRPGAAPTRRRPAAEEEVLEDGEEPLDEEAPPPSQNPSVGMLVTIGALLLMSIIVAYLVLSKRGFEVEIENTSIDPLQKVVVKINGVAHEIGDMRPNEINGVRPDCSPGNDVEVSYVIPNRGPMVKKLPKKDVKGEDSAPDFANFKGRLRIRIEPDGIHQTEY